MTVVVVVNELLVELGDEVVVFVDVAPFACAAPCAAPLAAAAAITATGGCAAGGLANPSR